MDVQAQAEQRVGATVRNKWKLERLLGVGGMAAVYVAVHKIGRREAIKILHPEVARTADIRARFEQEAHAVNRFKHPGAVEIRDIDVTEDGSPFLVMELLSGESLADRANRLGGIPLPEVLRLVDELLDVLVAAHATGIVHRDIKLDNLFVREDGRLKVLDFGIARVRDGLPQELKTRAGATLGTATYMPPEQIKGLDVDARADIFAVGATMFRLIARRRIHEAESETEMLLKMAIEPAPPLCAVARETPRDVGLVVDRALMFDRERRYPDAATMQGDIRALREGRPPPFASIGAPTPTFVDAPTRLGGDAPAAPVAPIAPPVAPILPVGTEPTMAASPESAPMAPPIVMATQAGSVGVGATAPPAGAAPGSRTVATGPRAEIAGGIGTELNLPTQTTGGKRAIGILDPAAKRAKIPLAVIVVGGIVVLLGIGGALFWAFSGDSSETAPSPAKSVDTSGRGHGPKPAGKRPAKTP